MNKHKLGAVIASAMLLLTFAGTAFAGDLEWNGKNGWPIANGCNQDDTPPGFILWIYTGDSDSAVKLTINGVEYTGVEKGKGSWHIITPFFDTKPSASLVFTGEHDAGVLTISHGCPDETTTTTTSHETTTSDETTTTTTETTTSDESTTSDETTETTTTTTQTGSINTQCINCTDTTTTTTSSVSINTQCINCTDTTTSDETTPGGHVEELTPPSTDTLAAPTSPSSVSTSLLLVLAGVLATALVVIPAAARKRR